MGRRTPRWSRFLGLCLLFWLGIYASLCVAAETVDAELGAWLTEHGPIRLAPDPDFSPVDFIDGNGRHRGISADLLALLARRSGLRIEIVAKPSFDAALESLLNGEVDVASSVFQSPRRNERFLFSNPYLRLPAALIARRDGLAISQLSDLRGRRIAVVEGHVWRELLSAAGFADEQQPASNVAAGLQAVADGQADAYIGDLLTADRAMRQVGLDKTLMVTGQSGLEAQLAFAIRRELPQLKVVLDQALAKISVADEVALRTRWEGAAAPPELIAEIQVPGSRARDLARLRETILARETVPVAERTAMVARVDAALAWETEADQSLVRVDRTEQSANQARLDIDSLRTIIATGSAEELLRWRGSLPQRASTSQLEQLLIAEQTARASLQEMLARLSQQAQELQQRPASLRTEVADLSVRLDALVIPEQSGELNAQVEREAVLAQRRSLQAQLIAAQAEQSHLEVLLEGADARKRERQIALATRVERISSLERLIAERSASEFAQELAGLSDLAARYSESEPAIRDLATQNLATGTALAKQTRHLSDLRDQALNYETQARQVGNALSNAQERLALGGVTESVGMLLLAERRKLLRPAVVRAQLAALQRETADLQLAQISVTEELDGLTDLGAVVARLSGSDADHQSSFTPEERTGLTELLLARSELLARLSQLQQKATEILQASELSLAKLSDDSQALTQLMDRHLLWLPSHPPINLAWFKSCVEAWRDLLRPAQWQTSWTKVVDHLRIRPLWLLALLCPFVLLTLRSRLLRGLQQINAKVRDIREDQVRYTLQALAVSAVLAVPMAMLWAVLGQLFKVAGQDGRFTDSLGVSLHMLVPYLYVFTMISVICRENGLGHSHFRWLRLRRDALLAVRPYLYFLVIPLLFVVALSLARDVDAVNATVLRSALLLLNLVLAGIVWWLLAPNRLFVSRTAGPDPHPGLRRLLRFGLVAGLLIGAVITALGYVFTSSILLIAFLDTLQVLFALVLANGLFLRWLVIGERRVALAQQQRQVVEAKIGSAGIDVPVVGIDSVNLRTISTQSRSLLRAFTVALLATGLLWSLAEVAPAFSLLDQVLLWGSSVVVDGVSQSSSISLADVLLALSALLIGVIAARNIPGLLEILLLKRFTEDASVRYAAVAVTRYLITFLMVIAVFGLVGMRWGDLQWLAAAFSVGLGFGLQEIFGNFVAGLILLFERPFRVGDVVTIGDLTGTVRRIRTRATTIVDFDNKDIVIPNKTFITDRFVNWTLTDTVTRIVLKVAVSYQSDPEQVRSTLLNLARAHPSVLAEPAPVALFLALADSTLNFELRCFVREIGDRLSTIDTLHSRIVACFRERGIEFSYPQLDVHLHRDARDSTSVDGETAPVPIKI